MISPPRQARITKAFHPMVTHAMPCHNQGDQELAHLASPPETALEDFPGNSPTVPAVLINLVAGSRCKMKGCVFPASDLPTGMCHTHDLQEREPIFFQSLQPILRVLEQAKYSEACEDIHNARHRTRRLKPFMRKLSPGGNA